MISKLAWKNIWFKPLNTILSIVLLASGIAIITIIVLLQKQFEEKFSKNIENIDLVLGAQGSPLQLILSSVYQVDNPTGNIAFDSAKVWMQHPFIKSAIPLAFGDNYHGFRIVGTNTDYIKKHNGVLSQGKLFNKNFEVVVGSEVANKLNLKLNDEFFGAHGNAAEGEVHDHYAYKVVGILKPTEKVIDNLILSNIPSVWQMHYEPATEEKNSNESDMVSNQEEHIHDENCNHAHDANNQEEHVHDENCNHAHDANNQEEHVHDENCNHAHTDQDLTLDEPNMEITAVLLQFKNKMGIVTWPRLIAQNTKMQAASPAIEVNRLISLFGVGIKALQYLAYAIMLISGISIFITLYNRLKERHYEFSLMRVFGSSKLKLFTLVLLESIFLCIVGYIIGSVLGRVALAMLSLSSEEDFKMAFNPYEIIYEKEGIVFAITILIGIIAALIPAIKAYKINISKTLANAQ